jgi:hypothetical protein
MVETHQMVVTVGGMGPHCWAAAGARGQQQVEDCGVGRGRDTRSRGSYTSVANMKWVLGTVMLLLVVMSACQARQIGRLAKYRHRESSVQ